MKHFLLLPCLLLALIGLVGCGGTTRKAAPQVTIVVSPQAMSVIAGQTQQFTASVTGATNPAVTWSVSCSTTACGAIDANGMYTAPAMLPTSTTVTITATLTADSTKSGSATVTHMPLVVTVTPAAAKLNENETTQFAATVTNHSNTAVTWSVSGTACPAACGTISSSGLYTAPAAVEDLIIVNIIATSVVDPSKSGTAKVTLIYAANLKLKGSFAFNYLGYDASQKELYGIGSFIADGEGTLTGWMDLNGRSSGSLHTQQALTGTYHMNASDNRGRMTLTVPSGAMTMRIALRAAGDAGRMILYGSAASGAFGLGEFKRQTTSDFLLSQTAGDYAMGMNGTTSSGEANAIVGSFHSDGNGALSAGFADSNEVHGSGAQVPFTGSLSLASASSATPGRGTLTVVLPAGAGFLNFSVAMVNNAELFVLSAEATNLDVPLLAGRMLKQSGGPFSSASFNGTTVFYLSSAIDVGNSTSWNVAGTSAMIGQTAWTNGSGREESATNNGGNILYNGAPAGYQSSYDTRVNVAAVVEANGRVVLQRSWLSGGATFWWIAYLVSPNRGFVIGYPNPQSDMVWFGFFEPQSAGPFSVASINGDYVEASMTAPAYAVPYNVGLSNWTNTATSGIFDWSNSHDGSGESLSATGTYDVYAAATGAFTATSVSNIAGVPYFMYIISPDKFVYIPISTTFTYPPVQVVER